MGVRTRVRFVRVTYRDFLNQRVVLRASVEHSHPAEPERLGHDRSCYGVLGFDGYVPSLDISSAMLDLLLRANCTHRPTVL